jgi:hypothetical protein
VCCVCVVCVCVREFADLHLPFKNSNMKKRTRAQEKQKIHAASHYSALSVHNNKNRNTKADGQHTPPECARGLIGP